MASPTKPVCKYGSSCYRKNPSHLAQFSHEDPESERKRAPPSSATEEQCPPLIADSLTINEGDTNTTQDTPPPKRVKLNRDVSPGQVVEQTPDSFPNDEEELTDESIDVRENIRRKFLMDMPEDFYQLWEFCQSLHPSQPETALELSLGIELVGPYHALGGRLRGIPWQKCVLHYRHYYDPPEVLTVLIKSGANTSGYHIGYFRDDPRSVDCLVVSSSTESGCEMAVEGDTLFSVLRRKLTDALKEKGLTSVKRKALEELSIKLTSFTTKVAIPSVPPSTKDLWKQRQKLMVANCFHKMGIVVPYDKKTELGYRSLTMTDRELKRLFNQISSCTDEAKRDQLSEPLQEIVTYVQFANDECDYGMGLELGLDLFCHGDQHFHTLIGHLLPVAYDLLSRKPFGKICSEHLKQRDREPLNCTL